MESTLWHSYNYTFLVSKSVAYSNVLVNVFHCVNSRTVRYGLDAIVFRANQLRKEVQTILNPVYLRRFKGESDFGIISTDLMSEIYNI